MTGERKNSRKLSLAKETLRVLDEADLLQVVGGVLPLKSKQVCDSMVICPTKHQGT